jgi:transposase, IS30 family
MASHLTMEERDRIAQLRCRQASQKEIARALGRSPATVSRELRRNRQGPEYYAAQAQRESERRRRERPLSRKMEDPQINQAVRSGLAQEWAPAQIAGRMKLQAGDHDVSPQTIYAWIKQDEHREHWESLLRRRGKRPLSPEKHGHNAGRRTHPQPARSHRAATTTG